MSEAITVHVHAKTDVGMRRQGNEDSFLVADLSTGRLGLGSEVTTHQLGNQGSLMIVSDGLGGAAAGEVASAMAVQTVFTELMKTVKSVLSPTDRLKRATEMSNDQIWKCAQEDSSLRGMGATLTAAFIQGSTVYIAQVGDSRAYIVRNKKVKQVTEDQSWANAIKKAGLETKDVPSNVILQALGTQPKVHVEVTSVELCNNDALLLCSDGLSNKVQTEEMNTIIEDSEDLTEACQRLVELANKRGGEDNITVVLARFEGEILNPIHLEPPSITSTFKVVAPLDFLEATDNSLDSTETMSFREPSDDSLPDISEPVLTLSDLPQLPDLSLPTPISSKADKSKTPNLAQPLPVIEKPLKIEKIEIENREPLVTSGQVGGVEKAKEKFEEQPILEVEKVEASRVINKEVTESDDVLELPPLSPLPVTPAKAASSTQNPLEMPIMETPSILADKDSLSTLEDRSEQRKKLSFAETKGDLPVVTEESAEAEKKNRTGNVSSFNIPPETQPVPKLQLDDATSSNEVKVSEFEMPKFGIETTEIPKLETPTIEVQVEQPVIKPTKPLTGLLPEIKDIKPAPSMFQPPLKPGMQMKDAPNLTLDSSLFTPSPFTTPKESEPKTPKLSQPTGFSLESSLFSPTAPQSSSLENPVPKPGMQMKDAAEFSLESSLFSVNPSTSGQSPEQKAKEVESMFAAPLPPPPAATSPKTKSAESQSPFANAPTFFSAEELTANSAVKSTQPLSFEKTSSLFMPPPKVENQTDLEEVDAKTKEEKMAEEKIEEVKKPEPLVSSNATSPLTSPLPSLPLPLVQQSTEEKPQPAKAKLSGPEVLASIFSSPPTSAQPSGQAKSSVTTKFEPKASATVPLGSTEPKEAQQKPAEAPGRAKLPPLPPKPAVDQSTSALFFPPPPTKSLDQTAKSGVLLIGDTKPAELPTKTPAAPQITKPETGKTANLFSPPPPGVGKTSPLTPPQGSQKAVPPPVA
ncbi:MAG: protein phosphatase 2C domain-containing protein, partial [Blastocatellia bacterium]|nr:protein phosphatase 2C domain-containing protein [Blastocatellia bacterium]